MRLIPVEPGCNSYVLHVLLTMLTAWCHKSNLYTGKDGCRSYHLS